MTDIYGDEPLKYLEQTPQRMREHIADLERQVAALTKERDAWREDANISKTSIDMLKDQSGYRQDQLSASQAREQKLRKLLNEISTLGAATYYDAKDIADEALSLPTDDTALQARLKEEREKVCALNCLNDYMRERIRSMT